VITGSFLRNRISTNSIFRNLQKDFKVEFRNRYSLNVSVSFAIVSTLSISLAAGGIPIAGKMQAVIFWIILFFSAMNGLSHIFIREEEQGTAIFLRLNAKPWQIFTSKLIFNISLFLFLQIIITPLFIFFLDMNILAYFPFILTVISGGIALSSSTTILAAIAAKSGGKGPLFTVISFPIVLPILWIASESTNITLVNRGFDGFNNIIFLIAFSGVIIALSYILFEYIWIED
jgi:heme exporter protein B